MADTSTVSPQEWGTTSVQLITRACDMCRKKKIRCQPTGEVCVQCIRYKTQCHFTPIETKRRTRRLAGQKHVQELEERLKRMESLLENSGHIRRGRIEQASQNSIGRINLKRKATGQQLGSSERRHDSGSSLGMMLETSDQNAAERSSSFEDLTASLETESSSFVSIEGQQNHPTYLTSTMTNPALGIPPLKNLQLSVTNGRDNSLSNETIFSRRIFKQLPSKASALVLVNEAFHNFNAAFPIFDQACFMRTFHDRYSYSSSDDDPSWWASLNVVLALAHRFRAIRTLDNEAEDREAWGYLQNALAVVTELTMLHTKLFAVQALLGMAIVIQGTPNPRPCSVLISATIKLAQSMGLHKKNEDLDLSDAEIEQRKRVFWIAYLLDKDISLRTGQPPAQDDDDMDVDLPAETIDLNAHPQAGMGCVNFFNLRIGLAIIQGQIYKRLCSVKAMKQSQEERLLAVQELDAMLHTWRASVPIGFDGEYFEPTARAAPLPAVIHTLIIRFTYFNSLNTIHSPPAQQSLSCRGTPCPKQMQAVGPNISFQCRNISSDPFCVEEARRAIQLVQITPQGDYACVWLLIHFFVSAISTLLENILVSPSHPLAKSDLQLIQPLLVLLEFLAQKGNSDDVVRMQKYVEDAAKRAREAMERADRERSLESEKSLCPMSMVKRKSGEKESVEEFIQRIECISADCGIVGDVALAGPNFGVHDLDKI